MIKLTLRRFAESVDGTYGRIEHSGRTYSTLEEEWLDNKRNVSRIPAGTYRCVRTVYYKHGYETFEVTGVPDRSRILFHPGNTEEDTQGCIMLGYGFGPLVVIDEESGKRRAKLGIYNSGVAFNDFMEELRDVEEFELEIVDDALPI